MSEQVNATKMRMNVERYGLESVPESLRQTKWYEYALIQGAFSVNAGNFLLPAFAVMQGGLSIFAATLTTLIGATLAFWFVSILSVPGARYGIPSQYAIRSMLGVFGARWISSPVRAIVSLYWFSVQTIGGTILLKEILAKFFHVEIAFSLLAIASGTVMAVLAMIGFDAIKKALIRFFPILLLGQFVILYLFLKEISNHSIVGLNIFAGDNFSLATMLFYGSLTFVQYISAATSSADLTRYAKSEKHGYYGLLVGNVVGFTMTAVLATICAAHFSSENPFVAASLLTDSIGVVVVIFVSAMLSMISINLNNAYTGAFCLLNSFPQLGRIKAALIFGVVAIALSTLPRLVSEAEQYISLLGLLVIPLTAVIIIDYIWVKRGDLLLAPDSDGRTRFPDNKIGLLFIMLGAVLYFSLPESYSPGFVTFLLIGFGYWLAVRVYRRERSNNG